MEYVGKPLEDSISTFELVAAGTTGYVVSTLKSPYGILKTLGL